MTLIVEDGTGKSDAESFATAAELVAYAAKFGLTIPATTADQEALLRRAALQMQTLIWKGYRTFRTNTQNQALSWPRQDVTVDWETLPNNLIPARIQYGQMSLAAEIYADDLSPPEQRRGPAIRQRVEGAVEVEYGLITSANTQKLLPAAPDRPSHAQFADYLAKRGLFAVRA